MGKTIYSEEYKRLLDFLIEARGKTGLTQQQLAKKLGKPQSYISKYEHGERRLDVVEFIAIAKILKADMASIVKALSG